MTACFAGARSLDERRRRRLASGANVQDDLSPEQPSNAVASAEEPPSAPATSHFTLRKLISRRLWKIWGIGFLGLALGAGLLYAAAMATSWAEQLGPGFVSLFGMTSGRAVTYYGSLQFLLASQLALIIWWVRSRSLQDFSGRYRVWVWVAAVGFLVACCIATEAHLAWSETVCWLWKADFWNANNQTLCWLVPTLLCAAGVLGRLHCDMRGCRSSLGMLWLAVLCWFVAGVMRLGILPSGVELEELVGVGTALFGHLCLFTSMLLHTRHVVYESAEPPQIRPSWFNLLLPWLTLRSFRGKSTSQKSTPEKPATSRPRPSQNLNSEQKPQPLSRQALSPASSSGLKPAAVADGPVVDQPVVDQPLGNSEAASPPKPHSLQSSPPDKLFIDEPLEKGLLKGLSKRERRKLRKQWREQDRTS